MRDDWDVVFAAISQNGYALQYASERLRGSESFIIAALRQKGKLIHENPLKWASTGLKDNRNVIMEAVRQDGPALQYASVRTCLRSMSS